jgi:hypothetical protein
MPPPQTPFTTPLHETPWAVPEPCVGNITNSGIGAIEYGTESNCIAFHNASHLTATRPPPSPHSPTRWNRCHCRPRTDRAREHPPANTEALATVMQPGEARRGEARLNSQAITLPLSERTCIGMPLPLAPPPRNAMPRHSSMILSGVAWFFIMQPPHGPIIPPTRTKRRLTRTKQPGEAAQRKGMRPGPRADVARSWGGCGLVLGRMWPGPRADVARTAAAKPAGRCRCNSERTSERVHLGHDTGDIGRRGSTQLPDVFNHCDIWATARHAAAGCFPHVFGQKGSIMAANEPATQRNAMQHAEITCEAKKAEMQPAAQPPKRNE